MGKYSGSKLSRWSGVEEFLSTVETGSFTSAAQRLGVSKSYISKQISQLEKRLGARLLQRTTRQLTLTDIGRLYYEQCASITEKHERLEADLSALQSKPHGTLRLALNSRFGVHYMTSVIVAFAQKYPDLRVEVQSSSQPTDLMATGFDLTLRYGELEDSSLYARKLGNYDFSLYASPAYWASTTLPDSPEDLINHNCIVTPERYWCLDIAPKQTKKVKVSGNWVSDNGATLLAAACEGIGITQLPNFYAHDAVQEGKLVKLRKPWSNYSQAAWAVYPHNRQLSAKISFFIDFLEEHTKREWLPYSERFVDVTPPPSGLI